MFDVKPQDIAGFGGDQLVELLRRLLYAEAEAAEVPLFNVSAPLQITVSDGGEDASVAWTDGASQTAFFPHRDVVFQCKATDPNKSGWKKEIWTKASQKGHQTRVLNDAVAGALARGASYVGVTATPLVAPKPNDRVKAIKDGIEEAGGDPTQLHSVHMYEGNQLAAWATRHRAVALWVKEQQAGMSLASFFSLDQWAKRPELSETPFTVGKANRFAIGDAVEGGLTFEQFSGRLVAELSSGDVRSVRVTGASGLGKSRGVFEAVRQGDGAFKNLMEATTVFCDYRQVSGVIWDAANSLATHGTPLVLIVDECPRDDAKQLHDIAAMEGSRLRVVTLHTDVRSLEVKHSLEVRILAADEDVISPMLLNLFPTASPEERAAISDLCAGFPRIAVLAARGVGKARVAFNSEADAARSILRGAGLDDPADLRALGALSLFNQLSFDRPPEAFDAVADQLARMSGDEMFDRLVTAVEAELAGRYGNDLSAQPRPIANYLAIQRLEHLRPSTLRHFLLEAPPVQRAAMLARARYLRRSATLKAVASEMLGFQGDYGEPDRLLTLEGAQYAAAFVHVAPNLVADAIHHAVQATSIDRLRLVDRQIGGVREALQLLVAARETFPHAMQDLLRLSAAEQDRNGGPASDLVEQLFHLHLSGTTAPSRVRFAVIDEVLKEGDESLMWACLRALEGSLEVDYFMRIGVISGLGDGVAISGWEPKTGQEIIDHLTAGLERLTLLRSRGGDLAERADRAVATRLRRLLWPDLIAPIEAFIAKVVADRGFWPEAAKSIGDWLYFDRSSRDQAFGAVVRQLYDTLLPNEPEARAVVFSQFWPSEFRDPEDIYRPGATVQDYDWSSRQAAAVAPEIASDPDRLKRVVADMSSRNLHSPAAFTDALAPLVRDPLSVLRAAVTVLDEHDGAGLSFVRSLLRSLEDAHPTLTNELAELAQSSVVLSRRPILIHASLKLTSERIREVAQGVRAGLVAPDEAVQLSFGRRMDDFEITDIDPLLDGLIDRSDLGGAWAAIEILSMFFYGRDTVTPVEAEAVRRVLIAPLGDEIGSHANSGHAFGVLVGLLNRSGGVDASFGEAIASQVIGFAQASPGGYNSGVVEALQEAVEVVVKAVPLALWSPIAAFYEVATRGERRRLYQVISKRALFAEGSDAFDAGHLFGVPSAVMLDWAALDPENRVGFLIKIFPILELDENGDARWHPAFVDLVTQFGATAALGPALGARIFPNSWAGSIEDYLLPYRAPLTEWVYPHPLALWAETMLVEIDRKIDAGW